MTWRTYETAKIGSIPEDALAMMEIVPVGAIVVTVAFRMGGSPRFSYTNRQNEEKLPRFGQITGSLMPLVIDKAHNFFCEFQSFFGIIGDAEKNQHVRPAHHAQPDFSISEGHLRDLGKRIFVELHHVIQKADRQMDNFLETFQSIFPPDTIFARLIDPRLQDS